MFRNRLVNIMLIILIVLTLVGVAVLIFVNYFNNEDEQDREPTIDEIISQSYETEEITTNLLSNDFVRARFLIHVDNRNALQEVQKRDFQVNNIIIRSLAGMDASQLSGADGIEKLEAQLQDDINALMQEGSVVKIYTTEWVIQ